MALALLDGTSAAFDFKTDVLSADISSANTSGASLPAATSTNYDSWKCVATYLSLDIEREMIDRTTFCTGGWRGHVPALLNLTGRIEGFASKGGAVSSPLYMFATAKGVPMVATIDTGCTVSANIMAQRHHTGLRAQANSEMAMEFQTDGTYIAPAFVWA